MTAAAAAPTSRLPALDWMRGLVMAVMTVDHCDMTFNSRHAMGDSAGWRQEYPLSPPDFLTRWCTHLCAPSFVFLAGTGMALSVANARRRGESEVRIDRHLLLRCLVLLGVEVIYLSYVGAFLEGMPFRWLPGVMLQVIYAIAIGVAAMVPLRRLPPLWLASGALLSLVAFELLLGWPTVGARDSALITLVLRPGPVFGSDMSGASVFVLYPALTWLPAMMLGWVFGSHLHTDPRPMRRLLLGGAGALALFGLLRGLDAFGNMSMHRRDGSVLEWLNCSKYPPSITYLAMELGLMALLLAAAFRLQRSDGRAAQWNPLLVIGQVPLIYYMLHFALIAGWRELSVFHYGSEWWMSWIAALVTVVALLPVCAVYGWYKRTYKHAWTRYL